MDQEYSGLPFEKGPTHHQDERRQWELRPYLQEFSVYFLYITNRFAVNEFVIVARTDHFIVNGVPYHMD